MTHLKTLIFLAAAALLAWPVLVFFLALAARLSAVMPK